MIKLLVDVAVFAPLRMLFSYQWVAELGQPIVGIRVKIPLGSSYRLGVICAIKVSDDGMPTLKNVHDRLDIAALYDDAYQSWLKRAGRYYLAPEGQVWEMGLAWAQEDKRRFCCVHRDALQAYDAGLAAVFKTKAALSWTTIMRRIQGHFPCYRLLQAVQHGDVALALHTLKAVKNLSMQEERPESLRPIQRKSVANILKSRKKFQPFLLFGVTGSGKTEVYLKAAEALVKCGRQVLILVPEIGLTPMWLARLSQRFQSLKTWHSAMSDRERISVRASLDSLDVLIGTRSALFLPLSRLSMIVVDEEHDASFKQHDGVAYSARDLALLLAQEKKIPVVLGSATPSLENWRQVQLGYMKLLEMPERISGHAAILPEIVDMRGNHAVLSDALIQALRDVQAVNQQSILFLNRRGYAPALQCSACGFVAECHACSLRLTLHRQKGELRCHGCGYVRRVRRVCETCGEDALLPLGVGTEKIEEVLQNHLPDLRFARFDRDVVRTQRQLQDMLQAFADGSLDCLIGTQMLVKGHHFPNVTLVGVVNADLGLNLPDFRAGERWWQQMAQVMGRAGRGADKGRVLIQTCNPEASWLARLGDVDARITLNTEMTLRKELSFPPFGRWVRMVFSSPKRDKAEKAAENMARIIRTWEGIQVGGAMACAMEKMAGRFRVEVLIRDASRKILPWKLAPLLDDMRVPSGVRRHVDVDPQDMM
ncbi:MAG: primosomal protein N' [Mariprofundaceae bacterium]|nr:primosomal protein N' [Mariprofundaceae bacterium]